MAELSIKVNIANRAYPLKVNADEEENIRKAAKMITERVKELGEGFSVRDTQDLLAMCALQFVNESLMAKSKVEDSGGELERGLTELNELVSVAISDFSPKKG